VTLNDLKRRNNRPLTHATSPVAEYFVPEIWAELWENTLYCNVEESFKKSYRCGSRCRWLLKFNGIFIVQRHISGEIFTEIRAVILREVANREINRQAQSEPPWRR